MQNLSGRTFAITGASGNLGPTVRDVLVASGANVVLLDRSAHPQPSDDAERVLGLGGLDLTNPDVIGATLDQAKERFGTLDGLVALAGAFRPGGTSAEDGWSVWDMLLTANLRTVVAAIQALVPRLPANGGRIVTIGARPAMVGTKGLAAYSASKAAILRLTESLSDELKARGVCVNCVLPSTIDTPQNRQAMPSADPSRWVPPEDIAQVIAFLLSDAARSVTGALIPVYGRA
jgi:NAD(P)-dependent dehydrogenase (short-subunit alcohol dehydrogenase family)